MKVVDEKILVKITSVDNLNLFISMVAEDITESIKKNITDDFIYYFCDVCAESVSTVDGKIKIILHPTDDIWHTINKEREYDVIEFNNYFYHSEPDRLQVLDPVKPIVNTINPSHYATECSVECIDAMEMAFGEAVVYDFCVCNAWKYIWRYKNKNGFEDLKKAQWYLDKAFTIDDYSTTALSIQNVLTKLIEKSKNDGNPAKLTSSKGV